MALIIKGEMPKSNGCDGCEFQTSRCEQLNACTCFLFNGCIDNFHNERHKDCPIIGEIPDKHGDLIDRQSVLVAMDKVITDRDRMIGTYDVIEEIVEKAPVVVEATE